MFKALNDSNTLVPLVQGIIPNLGQWCQMFKALNDSNTLVPFAEKDVFSLSRLSLFHSRKDKNTKFIFSSILFYHFTCL